MNALNAYLDLIYSAIWDGPLLILMVGLGLLLTVRLRLVQLRHLLAGFRMALFPRPEEKGRGDISPFQSLMTALAATIGIGNLAGVATAITAGGLGALFWMWVVGILGMATKFAEAVLAVKYRTTDKRGEIAGGPMYFIERGLGWKWLAASFAFCGALAALGGGNMIQANSVADVLWDSFEVDPRLSGALLATLVLITTFGGIKEIGRVSSVVVPLMALLFVSGGVVILGAHIREIPGVLVGILESAFSWESAGGGILGSSIWMAMRVGASRGLMSSEAGLGTASIAAAAAQTNSPYRLGLVSMTGTFLSTLVMCTITGLVLGVTGVAAQANGVSGAPMTVKAFEQAMPGGGWVVIIGLIFFAYSTILGWAYYGEKCVEYLLGEKSVIVYRIFFALVVFPGAVLDLALVWKVADIANALMAIPNLIGVLFLMPVVVHELRKGDAAIS